MVRRLLGSVLAGVLVVACGPPAPPVDAGIDARSGEDAGDGGRPRSASAAPSGAVCPDGSTLTYDSFGQGFFDAYCTRCHASTLSGAARMGAPPDVNLDSHAALMVTRASGRTVAEDVDRVAAGGAARINIFMPLSDPRPTDEERDQLGAWIACGIP